MILPELIDKLSEWKEHNVQKVKGDRMSKKVKMYIGFRYEAEGIIEVDSDWGENLEKLNAEAQAEIKKELDFMCLDNNDACESVLSDWMMSVEEVDDDTE